MVALGSTLALVAGCGGEPKIDSGSMEDEIESGLLEGTDMPSISVTCPDDITAEEGNQLECTAVAGDGARAAIEVTLTDDEGGFQWFLVPEEAE